MKIMVAKNSNFIIMKKLRAYRITIIMSTKLAQFTSISVLYVIISIIGSLIWLTQIDPVIEL